MPKLVRMHWGGWLDPDSVSRVDVYYNYVRIVEDKEGKPVEKTHPFVVVIERYNAGSLIWYPESKQKAKNLADKISLTLNGVLDFSPKRKEKKNGL